MTQLAQHIAQHPIIDTHEHLETEAVYLAHRPDSINALFGHNAYIAHDLITAGLRYADLEAALDGSNPDIGQRWQLLAPAWQVSQYTGYAEAVRLSAGALYGIDTIDADTLTHANTIQPQYLMPGQHARILTQMAHISHVQIDAFTWGKPPAADPAPLYGYDLNLCTLVNGQVDLDELGKHTGVVINTIHEYRDAIHALFRMHATQSVAVKTQHAYDRTLAWHPVSDDDAHTLLQKKLWGTALTPLEHVQIGNWALGEIATQCAHYHLPCKIHTGHYAGNGHMPIERIRPGHLSHLIKTHRDTTFILMHIGYPYQHELLSMAKHYANIYVDLCWAWSINPLASSEFVRHWIHSVPINKLFGFGGDAFYPTQSLGFALQTRKWLTYTLQKEVDDDVLTIVQAQHIATCLLQSNARALFGLST
jgi:predicted TIM-barrel fold metal-dependent hydrolase